MRVGDTVYVTLKAGDCGYNYGSPSSTNDAVVRKIAHVHEGPYVWTMGSGSADYEAVGIGQAELVAPKWHTSDPHPSGPPQNWRMTITVTA
jgi:hypothetical protein